VEESIERVKSEIKHPEGRKGEGSGNGWDQAYTPKDNKTMGKSLSLAIPAGLLGSFYQHVHRSLHGPCCLLPEGKIPLKKQTEE
jgi:hypothetical protein